MPSTSVANFMTDTERIDAMIASRAWRQPLIKFGSRDDIDAAILFGNPDKATEDYVAPRTRCPICGIASAFGGHICAQVGQRDLTGKPIFICPHLSVIDGVCQTCKANIRCNDCGTVGPHHCGGGVGGIE